MEALDYVIWSVVTLVLLGALFLALVASRPATAERPGNDWLIVPVIAVVVGYFVFISAGGLDTLHGEGKGFLITAWVMLLLIGVIGGSPLVAIVLKLSGNAGIPGAQGGIIVADGAGGQQEILRGGATIGYLERFMFMAAVPMAGLGVGALGILVLKGIGRFSEIGNANAGRERFMIGTLVSFAWAGVCLAPMYGGALSSLFG